MIWKHCVLVLCVLILIFVTVSYVSALKKDDEGACTVKISSPRTRIKYISYYSNKWCGKKKCVAKKSKKESYNVVKTQVVCCKGWEYNSTDDKCKPQCSTGCSGGRCVAPDVCACNPPAYLDPERRNTCVIPICQPACVNAVCFQNNTCTCKENYVPLNASHCSKKCDPGFEIDPSNLECVHQCDQGCMNGKCTGPNICTCDNGFKLVETFACEPICDPICVNASCVDTNVCACNVGYKNTLDSWICEPVCDSCDHGTCVGPNICSCDVGYYCTDNTNLNRSCINGDCATEDTSENKKGKGNERCGPGRKCMLRCDYHFKYNIKKDECQPICRKGCAGGICVNPDDCQCPNDSIFKVNACVKCQPGFRRHNNTFCIKDCSPGYTYDQTNDQCTPICDSGCINGVCKGPNTCVCNRGFTKGGTWNICVPECDIPCANSECIAPNTCSCHKGYVRLNDSACEPQCEPACINSVCVAPNTCKCLDGYKQLDSIKCEPICEGCINGDCIAPGSCKCHIGFKSENGVCVPKCEKECINADCSEPNVCICHNGYAYGEDKTICKPVCDPVCINASCVAPNKCKCNDGYEETNDAWTCKPSCHSCQDGICIAPDRCVCNDGYKSVEDKCEPICTEMCKNGLCTAPEECTCFSGYLKNENKSNECRKPCAGPCSNGRCTVHGDCICNIGYHFENDTCVTIKPLDCSDCSFKCADDICTCDDGRLCKSVSIDKTYEMPLETASTPTMLVWEILGGVGVLLLILVLIVIQRTWKNRKSADIKQIENDNLQFSVICAVPDTLKIGNIHEEDENDENDKATTRNLLSTEQKLENEL